MHIIEREKKNHIFTIHASWSLKKIHASWYYFEESNFHDTDFVKNGFMTLRHTSYSMHGWLSNWALLFSNHICQFKWKLFIQMRRYIWIIVESHVSCILSIISCFLDKNFFFCYFFYLKSIFIIHFMSFLWEFRWYRLEPKIDRLNLLF